MGNIEKLTFSQKYKNKVNSISLSPGGDSFVSGSEDGAVKIWDLGNFQSDSHLPPGPMQHDILSKKY